MSRRVIRVAVAAVSAAIMSVAAVATILAIDPQPPGPPYPSPVPNQAVYDYASVFSPDAITAVETRIDEIEKRTGSEIVVYSQMLDAPVSTEMAAEHARLLINQWGIGRAGYNDGLVVLFDLYPEPGKSQVQLYAGAGYRDYYLSNGSRQVIYDVEMKPLLVAGKFDQALEVAIDRIDAAATPENAGRLEAAQVAAIGGLFGAFASLVGQGVAGILGHRRARYASLHQRASALYEDLLMALDRIEQPDGPSLAASLATFRTRVDLVASDAMRREFLTLDRLAPAVDPDGMAAIAAHRTNMNSIARRELRGRFFGLL